MPYIERKDRNRIEMSIDDDTCIDHLGEECKTPGELNYVFTEIITGYLYEKGISYTNINEVIGALECCKLELYRRLAVPYEDKKIKDNGDVY